MMDEQECERVMNVTQEAGCWVPEPESAEGTIEDFARAVVMVAQRKGERIMAKFNGEVLRVLPASCADDIILHWVYQRRIRRLEAEK